MVLVLGAMGSIGDRRPEAATAADVATATPSPATAAPPTSRPTLTPSIAPSPSPIATPTAAAPASPVATAEPVAAIPLLVASPASGATVSSSPITVMGTAQAGARVVRVVGFGFDDTTDADTSGHWQLTIDLDEGPNELIFRVGDDEASAVTVTVTYAPVASPEPVETPEPAPAFATIEDGTWIVGEEIKPGTYRLREPPFFCYWARLSGFSGSLNSIKANANEGSYAVVTISSKDKGFESSGCGTWTKDLSRVTASRTQFDAGTFIVGTDLKPGTYRSSGGDTCYWARLSNFGGGLGAIIANGLTTSRAVVTIRSTDKGFTSTGCGTWKRR